MWVAGFGRGFGPTVESAAPRQLSLRKQFNLAFQPGDPPPHPTAILHTHALPCPLPPQAKAASMGDLGAEHWRGFVCVEAAQARSGAVQLAAGQAWSAGVEYEYDHLEES